MAKKKAASSDKRLTKGQYNLAGLEEVRLRLLGYAADIEIEIEAAKKFGAGEESVIVVENEAAKETAYDRLDSWVAKLQKGVRDWRNANLGGSSG